MAIKSSNQQQSQDMNNTIEQIKKITAIRRAFTAIDKKTKRNNTVFFGKDNIYEDVPRISTSMLGLDVILD